MTGITQRVARASAVTLTITLITGAIAIGAPQNSSSAKQHASAAESDTRHSEPEPTTLVLTPTEPSSSEVPGTLILRLASEVPEVAFNEDEGQSKGVQVARLDDPAVKNALRLRGSRYIYGGASRGGFDCSGFTRFVYARMGVQLPHSAAEQFQCGQPVSRDALKSGDLLFFSRGAKSVGHVGIYIGDGRFVHAANPRRGVTVDSLSSSYYTSHYKGARRVKSKK